MLWEYDCTEDMPEPYTMAASPSDHRAWRNIVAHLRRASGIDIAA